MTVALSLFQQVYPSSPEPKPNHVAGDEVKNKSAIEFGLPKRTLIVISKVWIYFSACMQQIKCLRGFSIFPAFDCKRIL